MENGIEKLKTEIIEALKLGIKPDQINNDAPLFGDGLGLDSIDALEIFVVLENKYGIKLTDPKVAKKIFVSMRALYEFVEANKK